MELNVVLFIRAMLLFSLKLIHTKQKALINAEREQRESLSAHHKAVARLRTG